MPAGSKRIQILVCVIRLSRLQTSWAIHGGYNHIRRVGNVVSLNLWLDSTSASSDTVGTVPSGFRPDRSFGLGILAPVNAIRLFSGVVRRRHKCRQSGHHT